MKKLLIIALALFTLNGVAQEKKKRSSDHQKRMSLRKDMTPKDIADLKSKKLTLKLDLTDNQQQQVHRLILKQVEKNKSLRKSHKTDNGEKRERLSKKERIKMQNHKLGQMIALKREMKTILTAEQYTKFEKLKSLSKKKRVAKGKSLL